MGFSAKHAFQSNKSDSGDPTLVQPSGWNAEHTLTATDGKLLGASGSATVAEITPGNGLSLSAATLVALNTTPYITRWSATYFNCQPIASAGSLTLAADTLYAVPIFISSAGTALAIGCNCTTLFAASSVRLGIYSHSYAAGQPGALLVDGGTVSTATTGQKEVVISQAIAPGTYWLVLVSNGTPILSGITLPGGVLGTTTGLATQNRLNRAFVFATLPADESGATYTGSASMGPLLWVHA